MALNLDAYDRIRAMIFDGSIGVGERLLETVLAERLAMSRTPVREALQLLLAEGVLETYSQGIRTRIYSSEEILEIYDCRVLLESESVRLTALSGLANGARIIMEQALHASEELLARGPDDADEGGNKFKEKFLAYNNVFHHALYGACPNSTLRQLTQRFSDLPAAIRNYFSFSNHQIEESHHSHWQIFNAVVSGESERAAAQMREHIWMARDRMDPTSFSLHKKDITHSDIPEPGHIPHSA